MKNLLVFTVFLFAFSLNAQTELWTNSVSKGAFMSQLDDGKIFLKDKTKIYLVNNQSGEIEWENNVSTKKDPAFLKDLPIMYFQGKSYAIIDANQDMLWIKAKRKQKFLIFPISGM